MRVVNGRSFLAFAIASAVPAVAAAQDLRQTRALLEKRHVPEAQAAVGALIEGGGMRPAELAEAYEIQGLAFVAAGDKPSAEGAFTTMLSMEPDRAPTGRYALDASDAMVSARTARGDAGALRIDAGMEERWRRGVAPVISAGVYGDSAGIVARVDVYYRPGGGGEYAVKTQQGAGPHRIELQLLAGRSPSPIDYYAEAFDDFGNQLVTRGTAASPEHIDPTLLPDARGSGAGPGSSPAAMPAPNLSVRAAPTPTSGDWQTAPTSDHHDAAPLTSKWWFWGGLGALAVGTIAVIAVASSGSEDTSDCFGKRCDETVGPVP
jgi:hypothetical protein